MVALINTALVRVMTAAHGLKTRLGEERGQDLIEYALIGGGVALAIILGFVLFDEAIAGMVAGIGACIDFDSLSPCP